jgi:hypothetical protein
MDFTTMSSVTSAHKPDMHGQIHPAETPELIVSKLKELDEELRALPQQKTVFVRQAQDKCPELLTDEFNLLFLRCEVFNAKVSWIDDTFLSSETKIDHQSIGQSVDQTVDRNRVVDSCYRQRTLA